MCKIILRTNIVKYNLLRHLKLSLFRYRVATSGFCGIVESKTLKCRNIILKSTMRDKHL